MKKNKLYRLLSPGKLFLLLLQILVLSGCAQKKEKGQDHLLSMIIIQDSITVYNGELRKITPYKKIPIDETAIKNFFTQTKKEAVKELVLHLKLSGEAFGNNMMRQIADLIRWTKESGINTIELIDLTEKDQAVFNLQPALWSYIDSLVMPSSLKLNLPKEEGGLDIEKIDQSAPSVLSAIISSPDYWYCYTGTDSADGSLISRNQFSALLKEKKKQWGEKLIVLVKLAPGAAPESIFAALEEKVKSKIENYEIIYPPPAVYPKRKLTAEHFLMHLPEPVEITAPKSVTSKTVPNDNAFLIEIRDDNTVWYQPMSPTSRIKLQLVKAPVTRNLKQIISDYAKANHDKKITYLIKGYPKATYPKFEEVVEALKENNIYNYHLVTTEEQ